MALEILQEYAEVGDVKLLDPGMSPDQMQHGGLVPWFIISKWEGTQQKHRLITDCRALNKFMSPQPFKLDHWQHIFPCLHKGMWAAKVDLKHAYFHLPLQDFLKPYLRLWVGEQLWEFQAAPFGLSTLPQQWMSLMKVFQRIWRPEGILVFIYLDDILILGDTPKEVQRALDIVSKTLQEAGMLIKFKKSDLQPSQLVTHLGFQIDLKKVCLLCPHKLKQCRHDL